MDRSKFYESLRARTSGVFGTSLSRSQVAGIEVILEAGERAGVPFKHLAYVLATGYHETGGKMQPVNEDLNYTSAARIREVWPKRFGSIAGAIPYVRNPQGLANRVYAGRMGNGPEASGDGWRYRGRALPQLTGRENYGKASRLVGVDLVADPDAANDTDISAHILVEGMRAGMFTGKKLADFDFTPRTNAASYDYVAARSIINDDLRANGNKVAGYARAFETALRDAASVGQATKRITSPGEAPIEMPVPALSGQSTAENKTPTARKCGFKAALAGLLALFSHQGA
nr:MAG TPA: putative chitinase [Caudoviricetes sp.]